MSKNLIATWYLHDDAGSSEYFPQAIAKSGSSEAMDLYMRCVCVFFASVRAGSSDQLVLFTNRTEMPAAYLAILRRLRVEIVVVPASVRPPRTKGAGNWANQFYIFDIIGHLSSQMDFDNVVVTDSDCIWRAAPDELFSDVKRYGALTLNLHQPRALRVNGISRDQMRIIYEKVFSSEATSPVYYCGGEFFAATRRTVQELHETFHTHRQAFFASFEGVEGGEEAHLLSLLYHKLDVPCGTGNQHIRRVWTTFSHNTVTPNEAAASITLLHLPAEKRTGFADLYDKLDTYIAADPTERLELENDAFGLPRRSAKKLLKDLLLLSTLKLKRRAQRAG